MRADAAIVTEPTELQVGVVHKGMVWLELETAGRAAHGSRSHLGEDAILKMAPALAALADLDRRLAEGRAHRLLGPPSLHASTIEGGREWSIYPDRCVLRIERRTIPGETLEEVEAQMREAAGGASVRVELARLPHESGEDEEIVEILLRHAGTEAVGVSYWADSALLAAAGIPTVLFGPAGEGAPCSRRAGRSRERRALRGGLPRRRGGLLRLTERPRERLAAVLEHRLPVRDEDELDGKVEERAQGLRELRERRLAREVAEPEPRAEAKAAAWGADGGSTKTAASGAS